MSDLLKSAEEVFDPYSLGDWMELNQTSPESELLDSGGPVHCICGRFAKYKGTRSYYNGQFDCATMYIECSRCGPVSIELV